MTFLESAWPYLLGLGAVVAWLLRTARRDRRLYEHIRDRTFVPLLVTYVFSMGALATALSERQSVTTGDWFIWAILWLSAMAAILVFHELDKVARLPPSDQQPAPEEDRLPRPERTPPADRIPARRRPTDGPSGGESDRLG